MSLLPLLSFGRCSLPHEFIAICSQFAADDRLGEQILLIHGLAVLFCELPRIWVIAIEPQENRRSLRHIARFMRRSGLHSVYTYSCGKLLDLRKAKEAGYDVDPRIDQLWISNRAGADGFQILCHKDAKPLDVEGYRIIAGIGFCVEAGKAIQLLSLYWGFWAQLIATS